MTRAKELPGKLSRVLAVTVNFRTPELTLRCLESLAAARAEASLAAVVVDNASGDGSVERLGSELAARGIGDWARLVAHPTNGGFGAGNNVALRAALQEPTPPDYFLLLNPDAALDPGALAALVGFLDATPRAGLCGPRTELGRGNPVGTAFRYPGILNSLDEGLHFGPLSRLLARWRLAPPPRSEPHRTDWLSGGCLLVRREVFECIGLFDEEFFLYFEEVDLSQRAERAGFESWFVPAANILHESGASTGVTGTRGLQRRMPAYWFESRRRYFLKHRGRFVCLLADLAWASGNALWNLRRWISRAPRKEPIGFFADFVRFNLFGRELRESR
ncbi:MAG: glycosyltransferase family 2 protein [Planctomycetota bacterium]